MARIVILTGEGVGVGVNIIFHADIGHVGWKKQTTNGAGMGQGTPERLRCYIRRK